jgi:N-methylhydantoinase A
MIVAPAVADASRTVVQLGDALDDDRLAAEFGAISELTVRQVPYAQTESVEAYADVRFKGQSHELKVRLDRLSRAAIESAFRNEYARVYGRQPEQRAIEIVTLRVRRIGRAAAIELPEESGASPHAQETIELVTGEGETTRAAAVRRAGLRPGRKRHGPLLVIDDEATTYVPPVWSVTRAGFGALVIEA